MKPRFTIHDMQRLAQSHGGECLSHTYVSGLHPLRWRCAEGHEWESPPSKVKMGRWCGVCAKQAQYEKLRERKYAEMQRIAAERGGECLSPAYTGCHDKLEWACAEGHRWWATPLRIQSGSWCRQCFFASRRTTLADVASLVITKGGRCLTKSLERGAQSVAEFECANGHRWLTVVRTVLSGCWCPECGHIEGTKKRRTYTYEVIAELAQAHNGTLLSPKSAYKNLESVLRFCCDKGHLWEGKALSLVNDHWCPRCSPCGKKTIEDLQALARERAGQCLSTEYTNGREKYRWRCAHGHEWTATYRSAKNAWCLTCKDKSRKAPVPSWNQYTIETMHGIAAARGWKVLSIQYKTVMDPLRWACEHGHEFNMRPKYVMDNAPCPICKPRKHSIESMQRVAESRGGKCLSRAYKNGRTKMRWQCANGHEWEALPQSILSGSWCHECKKTKVRAYEETVVAE